MKQDCTLLWLISGLLLLVLGCSPDKPENNTPLPFFNEADFTPLWLDSDDPSYQNLHTIPDFSLTDQNNQLVTENDLKGKIYVANFFFTLCPSICPKMTSNLDLVREAFQKDQEIAFISHSVMPWVDSVEVLKKFAVDKNVNYPQWHFVTGEKEEIYELARSGYFADRAIGTSDESKEFIHTENCILVDKEGRIRGVYNGTLPLEMRRLIADIHSLKRFG